MNSGSIRRVRSLLILMLDVVSISAIFSAVYYVRLSLFPSQLSVDLLLITATFVVTLFLSGSYFRERTTQRPRLPIRTFLVSIAAGIVCVIWLYLLGPARFAEYFGRGILPIATLLSGIATTYIRFIINRIYHNQEQGVELLYLGFSTSGRAFLRELRNHAEVRSVTVASTEKVSSDFSRLTISNDDVATVLDAKHWHSIVVDPSLSVDDSTTDKLISLRLAGTPVISLADFYEKYWFMIPVMDIESDWFLRSQGFSMLESPISGRIKRSVDIVLSVALLALTLPVILICAFGIKVSSKGPVFFHQTRVGLRGQPFTIYKLRTMNNNAEQDGAQWAQEDDPRITRFGKFLRQTRLDELPQCWNVLQGKMSFVGPRPERPEFTEELAEKIPYYELRHLVKPGISGWAQVIFPYGASVEDALRKLQYELYYIKNQSILLDLNIMLRTIFTVFQRAGR